MSDTWRRWDSWGYAVGIALLYTSAFYLPEVGVPQGYWLPFVVREILFPTLVGTIVLVPIGRLILLRSVRSRNWNPVDQIAVAALALIALTRAFNAVGYSPTDLLMKLEGPDAPVDTTLWSRIAVSAIAFVIIAAGMVALRNRREALIRCLSTLGYAYAVLAVLRAGHSSATPTSLAAQVPTHIAHAEDRTSVSEPLGHPRKVVWIIFDEMDYNQTLGSPSLQVKQSMPNLFSLNKFGVSAIHAFSPARDTEVSIPSLLLGTPPIGVRITKSGLSIHAHDGSFRPFDEAHSVFSRLPGGSDTGAILGFYHPYCKVFPAIAPCVAMPVDNVGRWFDALLPFSKTALDAARRLPNSGSILSGSFFSEFEPMYRISQETTTEFPRFLSLQDSALVFIHVNLPHPPGDYSQRALGFTTVADEREAYKRNLRLVDDMIGVAIATLRTQTSTRDILLIVSSDHWHRIDSPHQIQPIPWIAWHVGEATGATLDQQLSTVHTAELVVDFLRGDIQQQQDIVTWWRGKSFYPPLMPEHYDD